MLIVQGGRRSGKTTALLRWMGDAPEGTTRVVVAPTSFQAKLLHQRAYDMGIDAAKWQFRAATEQHLLYGNGNDIEVGVDEWTDCPEDLLYKLTPHKIGMMTETVSKDVDWSPEW